MKKFTLLSALLLCAVWMSFGQWTYTNLSEPKSFMGSAALGNKAYFAGGYNGTDFLTTVEVYDITTGTCEVIGDLSVPRQIIGGGISCGSKVFFPGGFDWSVSYSTVDIYNTLTGQWTVEALSQPRFSMTSVSYHDTVMFAGGFIYPGQIRTSRVDFYNVQTDAWSTAELSIAREGIASAVVGDIAIFAGGLVTVSSSTNRVDIYNFTTKTWSMATLSQARGMANAVTVGNLVIIAGGVISNNNPTDVVDIYNYETNTWSTDTISDPRAAQTNGANISGKAFFAGGGEFTGSGYRFPSDVIDIYDPASNTWSVDQLSQGLINHSVVGIDGYLIVAGGENDDNEYLSQIEVYHDPTFFEVPGDYASIQDAINAASDGDTVLVEDGTYFENINLFGRKPFLLASNFFFDGDTNHINNTIINGSQPVDPDVGTVVISGPGSDTTTILCGFTITGGTGTYNGAFRGGGGVIIGDGGGKLLNNHIEYNEIYYDYWTMGGGILTGGPDIIPIPWVVLRGNRIQHNKAISATDEGDGGGVDSWCNLIMEDNQVSWNEAEGPYRGDGGGVRCRSDFGHTEVLIRNNEITHNKSKSVSESTDIALTGGLSIFWDCSGIIAGNNVSFNEIEVAEDKWGYGTGILIDKNASKDVVLENNLIEGNTFTGRFLNGGGLCIWQSSVLVQNNIFKDNTGSNGGGIFVHTPNDTAIFINNTITGNQADYGGGIYTINADAVIANTIVWDNTATTSQGHSIFEEVSNLSVQYSDIEGETVWPGEGNINADPGLDDSCHIEQFSPCEDAGAESVTAFDSTYYAPLYDKESTPRPWHFGFDIGAYECDIIDKLPDDQTGQELFTAYPNPTDGIFNLQFTVDNLQRISLKIFDVNGREVATVFDGQLPAGEHIVSYDMSGLPAGVYYCRLVVSGQRSTVNGKILKF